MMKCSLTFYYLHKIVKYVKKDQNMSLSMESKYS